MFSKFSNLLHTFLSLTAFVQLNNSTIKGLVHPKMKILSVFTHPHVVPNL